MEADFDTTTKLESSFFACLDFVDDEATVGGSHDRLDGIFLVQFSGGLWKYQWYTLTKKRIDVGVEEERFDMITYFT